MYFNPILKAWFFCGEKFQPIPELQTAARGISVLDTLRRDFLQGSKLIR